MNISHDSAFPQNYEKSHPAVFLASKNGFWARFGILHFLEMRSGISYLIMTFSRLRSYVIDYVIVCPEMSLCPLGTAGVGVEYLLLGAPGDSLRLFSFKKRF